MKKIKQYTLPFIILFFVMTVAVFGPLELFITNSSDLWISFADTLKISLIMALVSTLVLGGIGCLLKGKARSLYAALLFVCTLCLYIQGNYLNINYGLLDGRSIDWSAYTKYAVVDTAFWAAMLGVVLLLWKKKGNLLKKLEKYLSLFFIAIQLLSLGYLLISNRTVLFPEEDHYLSRENMTQVGSGDNIIVFVLDTFDDPLLDEIFAEDGDKYREVFSDFTRFTDCAAGGATTNAAVPILITGQSYPGIVSYSEYVDSAFNSDGLYTELKKQNYTVDLYTEKYFVEESAKGYIDNYVIGSYQVSSFAGLTQKYSQFVLYKYAPHILKQFFWLYTAEFNDYIANTAYTIDDSEFFRTITEDRLEIVDGNVMQFFHLKGSHAPYDMNEYAQAVGSSTRIEQAKGNLYIVEEYINQMKELGVYDNSLIIVTADHGDREDYSQSILLVKERNAVGGFTENDAPVSHNDFHATLFDYLGADMGDTFFEVPENEPRERIFYICFQESGTFYMNEYLIKDKQSIVGIGELTGNKLSPELQSSSVAYGERMSFGLDGTINQYIVSGLDPWPVDHAVSTGTESCLSFDLGSAPGCDLTIDLEVKELYDINLGQHLRVYANDYLCHEEDLTGPATVHINVPAEAINDNTLDLRFEYTQKYCPLYLSGLTINRADGAGQAGNGFSITEIIGIPLAALMRLCYRVLHNYGLAIVLFTLLTKVILLPVSMWTQKNSIIMVKLMPELNRLKIKFFGDKDTIGEETQKLYKREHYHPFASTVPMIIQIVLLMGVIGAVKQELGSSDSVLNLIPAQEGGATLLMPLAAALAALTLTLAQNKIGPLQREQSRAEQLVTGAISVSISLFLGAFVSLGTGIYWISSNLLSIPFQFLLNVLVNPRKYVDYEALAESRKQLEEMSSLGNTITDEDKKREKADYKRFFSIANKHLVFYSEKSGFYKYFQNVIDYLLTHSNVIIHYLTNDPNDQIFQIAKEQPRIKPYFISQKKTITLMMKMDADMVVMTTPDLENYYIKRSYVRKDVEYVYFCHGLASTNMCTRKGAYDHFDTVMCVGPHQVNEIRETEEMYGLPPKELVPCGYGMLDNMLAAYAVMPEEKHDKKRILIAPSWQEGNILESCIDELIRQLYSPEHFVVVRPHPEFIKRFPAKLESLIQQYRDLDPELFCFETDFASNVTIYTADIVITDWSGIAQEFAFTTKKPVLLIDTPMKVLNPDYVRYKNVPLDITIRGEIGKNLALDQIGKAGETVEYLFANQEFYKDKITELTQRYVFNIGTSGMVGARYILGRLTRKKKSEEK